MIRAMAQKRDRQELIRDLLARNDITNQEQLQDLLAAEGVETTQATLSRDLRDIGAIKGSAGYTVAMNDAESRPEVQALRTTLQSELGRIDRGGTVLVLHTRAGEARRVAEEIDHSDLPGVLGTIAGDDTVFLAARSNAQASEILRLLRRLSHAH